MILTGDRGDVWETLHVERECGDINKPLPQSALLERILCAWQAAKARGEIVLTPVSDPTERCVRVDRWEHISRAGRNIRRAA